MGKGKVTCKIDWGKVSGIQKAVAAALYQEAQLVKTKAQDLTPVDTGALRSSAFVDEPKSDSAGVYVELGFGGTATKTNPKTGVLTSSYAIAVHENLHSHHPVGQAKFLEQAAIDSAKGMGSRVAARIEKELKKP